MSLAASGISLLAITGGAFLLAKTNKDNLGVLFKAIAWFVIVAGFLNLACTGLQGMIKFHRHYYLHGEMKMHGRHVYDEGHYGSMGREGCCMNTCEERCQKTGSDGYPKECCNPQKDSCNKEITFRK